MRVVPSGRSDEQIFADVLAALRDDAVADEEEIHVKLGLGRVTLTGTVSSFFEKRPAENVVAGVRGVTEIENKLLIQPTAKRPDKEITLEILRRFELSPYLAEGLIEVQVKDGVVTLAGSVGSVDERDTAGLLCWVAGVRQVDSSKLEVKSEMDRERRRDKFTVLRTTSNSSGQSKTRCCTTRASAE